MIYTPPKNEGPPLTLFLTPSLKDKEKGMVIMGLGATLPNHISACRSEFILSAQGLCLSLNVKYLVLHPFPM